MSLRTHCAIEALEARTLLSEVVASFKATQYGSHTFLFNSHSSKPGDAKKIEKALWRFGDGSHKYGGIVFHTFANPGTYRIRLTVTNGLGQSDDAIKTVTVGSTDHTASITGRIFNDRNFNGVRDSKKENWLANEKVWTDQNLNDVVDSQEISTTSDSEGRFSLLGLPGTIYAVTTRPTGILAIGGSGRIFTDIADGAMAEGQVIFVQYGGTLTGKIAHDVLRNGALDLGEGPGTSLPRTVWLDDDGNGLIGLAERQTTTDLSGSYTFQRVESRFQRVRVILEAGETQVSPAPGRGLDVFVNAGATTVAPPYMLVMPNNASLGGTVYSDVNGNNHRDPSEATIAGRKVFLDVNFNYQLDAGEPTSFSSDSGAYRFEVHASTQSNIGAFFRPRVSTVSGERQSGANQFEDNLRSVRAGESINDANLGLTRTAFLAGTLYADDNGNGKRDANEGTNVGAEIFIDLNNNGNPDSDEPRADRSFSPFKFEKALKPGSYTIRIKPFTDRFAVTQPSGAVYRLTLAEGEEKVLVFGLNFLG